MKKLILKMDYLNGPLWKNKLNIETGELTTGIKAVDENDDIQRMNQKIQDMFSEYYEFDSHGEGCWFNEEKAKSESDKMKKLIMELIKALDKINDGTFEVINDIDV